MNLTRCSNGHFYDMDKFDSCPHCRSSAGEGSDKTMPLSSAGNIGVTAPTNGGSDVTMPLDGGMADGIQGGTPHFGPPDGQQGGIGVTVPVAEIPTAPLDQNSPVPHYKGEITPSKPTDNSSDPAVNSLSKLVESAQAMPSASSEKTVGIYSALAGNKASGGASVEPVVGWLVCIKGSSFGASFTLKSGKNFIGRDRSMDVCIPGDKSISRQCHAIILYDPKSKMFLVQPGTSRELFYLNDKVVLGVEEIAGNDVMTIGKTDLMFIPCCSDKFSWEEQIKLNKAEEESDG